MYWFFPWSSRTFRCPTGGSIKVVKICKWNQRWHSSSLQENIYSTWGHLCATGSIWGILTGQRGILLSGGKEDLMWEKNITTKHIQKSSLLLQSGHNQWESVASTEVELFTACWVIESVFPLLVAGYFFPPPQHNPCLYSEGCDGMWTNCSSLWMVYVPLATCWQPPPKTAAVGTSVPPLPNTIGLEFPPILSITDNSEAWWEVQSNNIWTQTSPLLATAFKRSL